MTYYKGEDFDTLVSKGNFLIDFYADWCGPCKMLGSVLETISDIDIIKVNVDEYPQKKESVPFLPVLPFPHSYTAPAVHFLCRRFFHHPQPENEQLHCSYLPLKCCLRNTSFCYTILTVHMLGQAVQAHRSCQFP